MQKMEFPESEIRDEKCSSLRNKLIIFSHSIQQHFVCVRYSAHAVDAHLFESLAIGLDFMQLAGENQNIQHEMIVTR